MLEIKLVHAVQQTEFSRNTTRIHIICIIVFDFVRSAH